MTGNLAELGSHVDILTGYPFRSAGFTKDPDAVRLLRGDNVVQGKLRWSGVKRWAEPERDVAERYALRIGDVVLAMDRPWIEAGLKAAAVRTEDVPSLLVQRVARLRATNGLRQDFLRYLIASKAFTQHVLGVQTGTAVPHISAGQIRAFKFELPSERTQRSIAEVLGALDDKIDVNTRVAGGARRLAVAELARVADDCEWIPLGDVAVHRKSSVDPSKLDGNVQLYSIPSYDRDQLPGVEPASTIKSNKLAVPDRAVLVSRLNPRIPRVWFALPAPELPAMCSTEFLVLEPLEGLSRGALFAACAQPEVANEFTQRAGGTSGSHQRIKPADALSVPVPVSENDALGETLTALLEGSVHARREATTLSELRDALLPKLMSGEIRVGDAEELVEAWS